MQSNATHAGVAPRRRALPPPTAAATPAAVLRGGLTLLRPTGEGGWLLLRRTDGWLPLDRRGWLPPPAPPPLLP